MIEIARILCPVDFSEFSRHALHQAIALARWYDSALTVMYVFASVPSAAQPAIPLSEHDRQQLLDQMVRFGGDESVTAGLRVDFVIHEAPDVRQEILAQATALPADLLVIGSHGLSGFERLLLGSVTEKVVRKAPCPVMVVPARAPDAHALPLHTGRPRVLCPVDFSDASLRALEYAMSLAEESDADLTILHVIEVPPELSEHLHGDFDIDAVRAAAEATAERRLRELIPPVVRTYCTVDTVVREGAAHRQILQLASERTSDLIVMGVHGRGAVDRLLFGSNSARVIRAATCPVLIVRGT